MELSATKPDRKLLYTIQSVFVHFLYNFHKALPLPVSSAIGGMIGRMVGPMMKHSKYAEKNLKLVFPLMPESEVKRIVSDVWDNLGRTVCELPFIASGEVSKRAEIAGLEHLETLKKWGRPAIFVSGHFGNWELLPQIAKENGFPLSLIYRTVNNKKLDDLLFEIRKPVYHAMYPKGARGAINILRDLGQGISAAILVDQKMNSGIEVPFFDRTSMTASAVAELAMKFDAPIVMAKVVRIKGKARFRVTIYEPFIVQKSGNRKKDVLETMCRINGELENWIRENPEMWFWVHRRWSKELYL